MFSINGPTGCETGLRRSELFALKWRDVDFSNLRLDVLRSIYLQHVAIAKRKHRANRCLSMIVWQRPWLWKEKPAGIDNPTTGYS